MAPLEGIPSGDLKGTLSQRPSTARMYGTGSFEVKESPTHRETHTKRASTAQRARTDGATMLRKNQEPLDSIREERLDSGREVQARHTFAAIRQRESRPHKYQFSDDGSDGISVHRSKCIGSPDDA